MFAYLKSLFGGRIDHAATPQSSIALVAPRPGYQPRIPQAERLRPAPAKPQPASPPPSSSNGQEVNVSLQAVLNDFPAELADRILRRDVRGATLTISVQRALSQLPHGAVTLSYGELRQAAPQLFTPDSDCDHVPVNLPLNEILAQIDPTLIARAQTQKPAAVPQVNSPFEEVRPNARQSAAAPSRPVAPVRQSEAPRPVPATPIPASIPTFASTGTEVIQSSLQSVQAPSQGGKLADDTAFLVTPLASLVEAWPEALRTEIAHLNLAEAKVELPVTTVQEGLKRGKVVLPWKMIRSWVKPAPQPVASAYDNAALELPLEVLTPLFILRQRKAPKTQQKLAVDEAIPDLFSGPPRAESAPQQPAGGDTAVMARSGAAGAKSLNGSHPVTKGAEVFSRADQARPVEPVLATGETTPNEIVARAAALEGVAGALVALPDGLVVASKLSPGLNGEALAAFLPQFFGRISRGAKELGMGEVNNLNFTVDDVPWKISRVNSVFFAAFGRLNQALPATQLAALAAQLDQKH